MHGDRSMSTAVPDTHPDAERVERPRVAKALRALAIPILIFWILAAIVTNVFVPSIEVNTAANAEAEVPRDAPSSQAAADRLRELLPLLNRCRGSIGDRDHRSPPGVRNRARRPAIYDG